MSLDEYLDGLGTFCDREGNTIGARKWSELRMDPTYCRVDLTTIEETIVSTVWLGIDHARHGSPMFFETMVFGGDSGGGSYSTEAEAVAGHAYWVAWVRCEWWIPSKGEA